MKIILSLLLLFLFPTSAIAIQPASDTATSELRLVILPTIEHSLASVEVLDGETVRYSIGIRANTSWSVSYGLREYGTARSGSCQSSGKIGQRNLDNDMQFFAITCFLPTSWGDQAGARREFYYEIGAGL